MERKRFTGEQIIGGLNEAEAGEKATPNSRTTERSTAKSASSMATNPIASLQGGLLQQPARGFFP